MTFLILLYRRESHTHRIEPKQQKLFQPWAWW